MNESLPEAPDKPAPAPPLPPPDADPAADAESSRIAEIIERDFKKGFGEKEDHPGFCDIFAPGRFCLTWEEILDPRVLAKLLPETLCSIRRLQDRCVYIPQWILDRAAHFRGPCPDWVRALVCPRPGLLPVVWDKVRDDAGIRRLLAALSRKLPGGMPKTLKEDIQSDAFGRFSIHAAMCGFHWSPGGVAAMVDNIKGPKFFADLLERDEEFLRKFPPEKLLILLLRASQRKLLRNPDDSSSVLPLLEQLASRHPGAVRICGETLGWGNVLFLAFRSEEADFLIRHGADPDAPDFTGITYRMRRYCEEWYKEWQKAKMVCGTPPPFRPPESRTVQAGGPPPFPPEIFHPFTRVVLFDGRLSAIVAALRAHRADLAGYLREAKFRNLLGSPRILSEADPEFARAMLFPYVHPIRVGKLRHIFRNIGENAQIWAKRQADPEMIQFVRTYQWIVSRLGRRTFPTCEGSCPGVRFPAREGEVKSDVDLLRRTVTWNPPDDAAALAKELSEGNPTLVAWAELGAIPGAGLLWAALMPRLVGLFQKATAKEGEDGFADKAAVGRLLGTLARLGADPDAPAAGGFTPRQVADALFIPVEWPS